MARRIILKTKQTPVLLVESQAENELELQELVKDNPDLLPIDEFDLVGPLLVMGREATVASGSVDLVALTRGGEILIVEFKTGPQNSDFRHALAQLLDYGSDLWGYTFQEFETGLAHRYFTSDYCRDPRLRSQETLLGAARAIWPDLTEEEAAQFTERITRQLERGAFHYLLAAQRFTPTVERTIEYLNATMKEAQFYAVEVVRFDADSYSAFEARTVSKPDRSRGSSMGGSIDEHKFLNSLADERYREVMNELLTIFRTLGLRLEWGSAGSSIRLRTPGRTEPLSIGWLYPPGVLGWNGLQDLNLGIDPGSAQNVPSALPILEHYVSKVEALPGAEPVKPDWLSAQQFSPTRVIENQDRIVALLEWLVEQVGEIA